MKTLQQLSIMLITTLLLSACTNGNNPFWHGDKDNSNGSQASSNPTGGESNQTMSSAHAHQNSLTGSINGNVYTATIGTNPGNDAFSVDIPQANKADVWSSTQKQDAMTSDKTSVSFGPADNDASIYRLQVATLPKQRQSFKAFSEGALTGIINEMKSEYNSAPEKLYHNYQVINGHSTRVAVFSQAASDGKSANVIQIVYIVKQHNNVASFWISKRDTSKATASAKHRRNAAITMGIHNAETRSFVNSFKLMPTSATSKAGDHTTK